VCSKTQRRLIGPVIEVVVTEEADIGNENTGVDVQTVSDIPVIAAPGFGEVPVCVERFHWPRL
jgi:hypothetical protein